jgi:DNA (cytosine-5)-methyltransferase 1
MEVVSLFSGCGGTDLGFEQAGHQVIWSNDIGLWPTKTYAANFDILSVKEDVTKISNFPKAEVVVGCYPCQGFSQYGNKNPEDERNYLYMQFRRALKKSKPNFFVVENVKGLLFKYSQPIFKEMLKKFSSAGFQVYWKLLNAKNYGVPQDRERVFIVGVRKDLNKEYNFPEATHGPGIKPYVTLKDTIWDLRKPKKEDVYSGGYSSHYLSRNRKRKWEDVSFTIQASGRHAPLHPSGKQPIKVGKDKFILPGGHSQHRRLSFHECAKIQTFPHNFKFEGPLSAKYGQVGNAVPPKLAQVIANSLSGL